ncbi:MAG: divalent cation tolerance protein [Pseudomonadota bacterium]|jgi:periplasmic divalent cation tolerance protein
MDRLLIAICSAPNEETAKVLSKSILEARLAACVSRMPGVQSQYWWKGALENAEETLLMIKTTTVKVEALKAHIQKNHPYETPELIFVPIEAALDSYALWIHHETRYQGL